MTEPALVRLEGALTMRTIVDTLGLPLPDGDLMVDMSAVGEADSAALALLLDWMRRARAAGHTLSVRGMPAGLRSLSELYGLDEILPLEA